VLGSCIAASIEPDIARFGPEEAVNTKGGPVDKSAGTLKMYAAQPQGGSQAGRGY